MRGKVFQRILDFCRKELRKEYEEKIRAGDIEELPGKEIIEAQAYEKAWAEVERVLAWEPESSQELDPDFFVLLNRLRVFSYLHGENLSQKYKKAEQWLRRHRHLYLKIRDPRYEGREIKLVPVAEARALAKIYMEELDPPDFT